MGLKGIETNIAPLSPSVPTINFKTNNASLKKICSGPCGLLPSVTVKSDIGENEGTKRARFCNQVTCFIFLHWRLGILVCLSSSHVRMTYNFGWDFAAITTLSTLGSPFAVLHGGGCPSFPLSMNSSHVRTAYISEANKVDNKDPPVATSSPILRQ